MDYKNFAYTINYQACNNKDKIAKSFDNDLIDVLYLANGSIIKGNIIENTEEQVKILTSDNKTLEISKEQIDKIDREVYE